MLYLLSSNDLHAHTFKRVPNQDIKQILQHPSHQIG